jgi:hypothetical protein
VHVPIDAACQNGGVWPLRSSSHSRQPRICLRLTTLAPGLDRQSHVPCNRVRMRIAVMTRPLGPQPLRPALLSCWTEAGRPRSLRRHPFSASRAMRKSTIRINDTNDTNDCHSTPPRLQARLAPGSATPAQTGVAACGKLGLEIISGIKGAQPCHPTMR